MGKEFICSAGDAGDMGMILGRDDPWKKAWQPTPVFLPGESHGQRGLAVYSPWGHKSQTQLSESTLRGNILLWSQLYASLKMTKSQIWRAGQWLPG